MHHEPRVRDYTNRNRVLPLRIEASVVYEFLVGLFTHQYVPEEAEEASAARSEFVERIDERASNELKTSLSALASCRHVWLTLLGVASTAPHPQTIPGFIDYLAAIDPMLLRRRLLRTVKLGPDVTPADLDAAAAGDTDLVDRILNEEDTGLRKVLSLTPPETRNHLVALLRSIYDEIGFDEATLVPILERDAAAKQAMATSMEAGELVETATNGVTFEMSPGIQGVLLIPSVMVSPWVVISEHENLRIFVYPVADEFLTNDPATPPPLLVEVFKALGDERRLRILYLLSTQAMTLGELADKMDLAKSTTHHHLRTLRRAGLVRVIVGDEKLHETRTDALPETKHLLETYLSPPPAPAPPAAPTAPIAPPAPTAGTPRHPTTTTPKGATTR